jgi:hypothetical protein
MAIDGPLPRAAPSHPTSQSAQTNASAEASTRLESRTRAAAVQARKADGGPWPVPTSSCALSGGYLEAASWPAAPSSPRPSGGVLKTRPGQRLPPARVLAGILAGGAGSPCPGWLPEQSQKTDGKESAATTHLLVDRRRLTPYRPMTDAAC